MRLGTVVPPAAAASLARFRLDLSQEYLVLEITAPLLTDAMRLVEAHGIRAYDAVQLAAAAELNGRWLAAGMGSITLVSADLDLNTAATAEGLLSRIPTSIADPFLMYANASRFPPTTLFRSLICFLPFRRSYSTWVFAL